MILLNHALKFKDQLVQLIHEPKNALNKIQNKTNTNKTR
jgi:hypothetical protein